MECVDVNSGEISLEYSEHVVLATGHSARDSYRNLLSNNGVKLSQKGFAVGFRIEHPQRIVNEIQLGGEGKSRVYTKNRRTNKLNECYEYMSPAERLPVPSYSLATTTSNGRGCYSFCMCPGGQIVNSATDSQTVCVNGMSFSGRDSIFANRYDARWTPQLDMSCHFLTKTTIAIASYLTSSTAHLWSPSIPVTKF